MSKSAAQDGSIDNPLAGALVGAWVDGEVGRVALPALNDSLTRWDPLENTVFRLTGMSSYLNSGDMNQGSLSVKGSYGLSGIAKVSGALTVHAAKSAQSSTKTVSLGMNMIKIAGTEYIDFDNLDAAQLVSSLSKAAREELLEALRAFQALLSLVKDLTLSQIQDALDSDADGNEIRDAFVTWANASQAFRHDFGTGMVAAVLWGGWGSVNVELQTSTDQSHWSVGGSARFEFQGDGADASISAAYGHREDQIEASSKASVTANSSGTCVAQFVNYWSTNLSQIALSGLTELGDSPINDPEARQASIDSPRIAGFQPPQTMDDPALGALSQTYADLSASDHLGTLAQAASWHGAGGSEQTTFAKFIQDAQQPSGAAKSFPVDITAPIGKLATATTAAHDHASRGAAPAAVGQAGRSGVGTGASNEFQPMGFWVVDWAKLFPWLCSGSENSLLPGGVPQLAWALQVMRQDMLTLSVMYERYAACGITTPTSQSWPEEDRALDYGGVRLDFASSAQTIANFMADHLATASPADIQTTMLQALSGLGKHARSIYDVWDANGFLRTANLGLGVCFAEEVTGTYQLLTTQVLTSMSTTSAKTLQPHWIASEFDPDARNYDVFAQCSKASPLILPDGTMRLFVMGIPADPADKHDYSGLLAVENTGRHVGLTKSIDAACDFSPFKYDTDTFPQTLETGLFEDSNGLQAQMIAYPLPFSAAQGDWQGTSVSLGVGDLAERLKELCGSLDALPAWSFDSEHWTTRALQTTSYSMSRLGLRYIGVVDEPPNGIPSTAGARLDDPGLTG